MRAGTYLRSAAAIVALGLAACGGGGGGVDIEVESVEPNQGPLGGGQTVILEGSGFLAGGSAPDLALFGGVLTTQVSALSDNRLQVVTPHNAEPGDVDVLVFNTNGYTISEGAYTYMAPPTITAVDADAGHYKGGDEVTITGTGFQEFEAGQPTLTFDGVTATNVRVQSDTEILAIVPAGTPLRRATAALSNNRGDAALPQAYLYTAVGFIALTGRGQNDPTSALYFVDAETGEASHLVDVPRDAAQIVGMATDENTVYGVATHLTSNEFGQNPGTDRSLYILHPASGELELVGPVTEAEAEEEVNTVRAPELEFHDGTLYAFNSTEGSFGSIDEETGLFTQIGDEGLGYGGRGSGLASDGNTLYYLRMGQLYTVNVESGQHSPEAQNISGIPPFVSGWTYLDGALYVVDRGFPGGGGAAVSRVLRIDLDQEPLVALPFATVPTRIHAFAIAPEIPSGGAQ